MVQYLHFRILEFPLIVGINQQTRHHERGPHHSTPDHCALRRHAALQPHGPHQGPKTQVWWERNTTQTWLLGYGKSHGIIYGHVAIWIINDISDVFKTTCKRIMGNFQPYGRFRGIWQWNCARNDGPRTPRNANAMGRWWESRSHPL